MQKFTVERSRLWILEIMEIQGVFVMFILREVMMSLMRICNYWSIVYSHIGINKYHCMSLAFKYLGLSNPYEVKNSEKSKGCPKFGKCLFQHIL